MQQQIEAVFSVVELPKEAKSSIVTVAVTSILPDYLANCTMTLSIMALTIMTLSITINKM